MNDFCQLSVLNKSLWQSRNIVRYNAGLTTCMQPYSSPIYLHLNSINTKVWILVWNSSDVGSFAGIDRRAFDWSILRAVTCVCWDWSLCELFLPPCACAFLPSFWSQKSLLPSTPPNQSELYPDTCITAFINKNNDFLRVRKVAALFDLQDNKEIFRFRSLCCPHGRKSF